ncbi:hypothetical protein [Salipaludibacillus daqingensis]|uniref:hypothetical protein n=1 Tax=Salipaludibacillus daqingensis TaxID=3041001 RepID=UPI0024730FFC|nr:hypothetical protein [Salipaludibacillus daqingensis]
MAEDVSSAVKSSASDAEDNKLMAVLAYLGILVLIPLLAAKESRFAQYHTNQGLVLLIFGVIGFTGLFIISSVATFILGNIPVLGALVGLLLGGLLYFAAWVFFMIIMIMGIMNAAKGQEKPLPLIGKYNILKLEKSEQSV